MCPVTMTWPRNPYKAGNPLRDEHAFFGREDVLRFIETELGLPERTAVVLFGQRRIGKTSILLQLQRRLASPSLLPIYFDLMDCAKKPLGQLLARISAVMARQVGIATPQADRFDDAGNFFCNGFLPELYAAMPYGQRPVLLLDEFDVLDGAAQAELPFRGAGQAFFPYLRKLMEGEPRLGFIFVIGRKAEELSIDVKATFKAVPMKRVSVLPNDSARALIRLAERQGSLRFAEEAVTRILALTAGHPYLTQLLCQLLWNAAYEKAPAAVPVIEVGAIDAIVPRALETGEHAFVWIWQGLPPGERVILAAIAEGTTEETVVTQDELLSILQRHGTRILTRELDLAPETLVEWEHLRRSPGGYQFFVELLRRWIAERKPLARVKDELDSTDPLAEQHYRTGATYNLNAALDSAVRELQQALKLNHNHRKARVLLGQILHEQGKLAEAVRELEEAYLRDDSARLDLVRSLIVYAEELHQSGHPDQAVRQYERVLELSPHEQTARDRLQHLWLEQGDEASRAGDLAGAKAFYEKCGWPDKIAAVVLATEQSW